MIKKLQKEGENQSFIYSNLWKIRVWNSKRNFIFFAVVGGKMAINQKGRCWWIFFRYFIITCKVFYRLNIWKKIYRVNETSGTLILCIIIFFLLLLFARNRSQTRGTCGRMKPYGWVISNYFAVFSLLTIYSSLFNHIFLALTVGAFFFSLPPLPPLSPSLHLSLSLFITGQRQLLNFLSRMKMRMRRWWKRNRLDEEGERKVEKQTLGLSK